MGKPLKTLCPQCGYRIDDLQILRCPRCNKLLIEFLKCDGSCSGCLFNKNCNVKNNKYKTEENCRT